jgi:hypothetical protein
MAQDNTLPDLFEVRISYYLPALLTANQRWYQITVGLMVSNTMSQSQAARLISAIQSRGNHSH